MMHKSMPKPVKIDFGWPRERGGPIETTFWEVVVVQVSSRISWSSVQGSRLILRGGDRGHPGGPQDHLDPKVGRRGEPDTLSQPVGPGGVGGLNT